VVGLGCAARDDSRRRTDQRRPSALSRASTDARWDAQRRERQAANLLGALALAISDRLRATVTNASKLAESDAVALSALHQFLESPRVDLLAQVLGLTSSGTVRLIDRLEEAGLARRATAADGRVTSVALTATGRRRAQAVARARIELMEQALGALTPAERRQFGEVAGKVLAHLIRPPGATRWTCRLCGVAECGRPDGRCPVYEAAKARFGGAQAG
jgi:DNA-binding MarR family transcriptional regulator